MQVQKQVFKGKKYPSLQCYFGI